MKDWSGWADWFSIVNWAAFGLGYTIWRMIRHSVAGASWPFWLIWAVVAVGAGIIGVVSPEARELLRTLTIALWVSCELFLVVVCVGASCGWWRNFLRTWRSPWLFGLCVLAFIAAFACWIPSGGTDWRAWCDPTSPLQGHGFWHIFSATGTFAVFFLWASER